jgi:hypothetical protein
VIRGLAVAVAGVLVAGCAGGSASSDPPATAIALTAPAPDTEPATTTSAATTSTTTVPVTTVAPTDPPASTDPAATAAPATSSTSPTVRVTTPVPRVARTACTAVVHIGDSTSVGLLSPDSIADPAQRLDAQYARIGVIDFRAEVSGARSIVEALSGQENAEQVALRQRASGFHGCWVVAVGTNDAANIGTGSGVPAAERIDRMMAVIGYDPVLWVDAVTRTGTGAWAEPNMDAWNQALAAARSRYPNIEIYDWATVARPAWFQRDGIHYTSAGSVERARLIADALADTYPG